MSVVDVWVGVVVSVDVVTVVDVVPFDVVVVLCSVDEGAQPLKTARAIVPVLVTNMKCSKIQCDVIAVPIVLYTIKNLGRNTGFGNMDNDRVSLLGRCDVSWPKPGRSR